MANQPDVQTIIKARFAQLPKVIRDAITSADVEKHLRELATTHKLHLDQWEALENEVMMVLFGVNPIDQLQNNIKKQVSVTDDVAKALTEDISKTVFGPIRSELEQALEPQKPERQHAEADTEKPEQEKAPTAESATQTPPTQTSPVAPATPPAPAPTEKAARAPMSEAYKAGEPSTARRAIEDDPYREPLT